MGITILPTGFEGFSDAVTAGVLKGGEMAMDKYKADKEARIYETLYGITPEQPTESPIKSTAKQALEGIIATDPNVSRAVFSKWQIENGQTGQVPSLQSALLAKKLGITTPEMARYNAMNKLEEKRMENIADVEKDSLKKTMAGKESVPIVSNLMDMYLGSVLEMEGKYPNSSDATPKGRAGRVMAGIESKTLQTLPKTQAFQTAGKLLSYKMARAIEGGRVTDQDVDIVFNSLFNTDMPKEQALIQANTYVKDLRSKGLTDEEIAPLTNLIDMASGEVMVDKNGNRAFVSNGKVLKEL